MNLSGRPLESHASGEIESDGRRVSSDVDRSVPITYSLRIAVERWTTAATRGRLESALESGGPERLGGALREAPGIGSVGFRGEAAGVVRSARLTGSADQRRIELVVGSLPTIDAARGVLSFTESSDPVPLVDAIELDG